MSVTSKSPIRMAGAVLNSGSVNTGELQHVRGGGVTATTWSGAVVPSLVGLPTGAIATGSDVCIVSGAGRLNSILPHVQLVSGQAVFFYDSTIMTSGGPFGASGHKIVGILPPTYAGGQVSGQSPANALLLAQPINVDIAFTSGLAFNSRSGQPGFTITYTPATNTPQWGAGPG